MARHHRLIGRVVPGALLTALMVLSGAGIAYGVSGTSATGVGAGLTLEPIAFCAARPSATPPIEGDRVAAARTEVVPIGSVSADAPDDDLQARYDTLGESIVSNVTTVTLKSIVAEIRFKKKNAQANIDVKAVDGEATVEVYEGDTMVTCKVIKFTGQVQKVGDEWGLKSGVDFPGGLALDRSKPLKFKIVRGSFTVSLDGTTYANIASPPDVSRDIKP